MEDKSYVTDGFTTVKSLLSDSDLCDLANELKLVIMERRASGSPTGLNVWVDSPAALRLATAPSLTSMVQSLLGEMDVRLWHDQAFLRAAGSKGTSPHQDFPYWTLQTLSALTV